MKNKGIVVQNLIKKFLSDDRGMIYSSELLILATVAVIGLIVGLAEVRNQVVSELGDLALAIGQLDQSYSYQGVRNSIPITPHLTTGSQFNDSVDSANGQAGSNVEAGGVSVSVAAGGTG